MAVNPSGRFIRLGLTAHASACHCYVCFDNKKKGVVRMYYEYIMFWFLIVGIVCAVLFALVGEFILSFLCILMILVSICGLFFL